MKTHLVSLAAATALLAANFGVAAVGALTFSVTPAHACYNCDPYPDPAPGPGKGNNGWGNNNDSTDLPPGMQAGHGPVDKFDDGGPGEQTDAQDVANTTNPPTNNPNFDGNR